MGYRKYGYRSSRRKRRYSTSREYQPGLPELFGGYLGDKLIAFAKWITHALGRVLGLHAKAPSPQADRSQTTERRPLPLRDVPLAGQSRVPNYRRLPYRKVQRLVTHGETGVWYSLQRAVEGKYSLFCKARLADVVGCPGDNWRETHWFRKIGSYHVDFVICDPTTTAPLLVVELDDRRHREHARKRKDDFKDAVLRAAGLPIYRIAAKAAYDVEELKQQIERLIAPNHR